MVYPILCSILGELSTADRFIPFTLEQAKQDKIEIGVRGLTLLGMDADDVGFLNALRTQNEPFFNAVQSPTGRMKKLSFRSSSNAKYRTPAGLSLIAGNIGVRRGPASGYERTPYHLTADLSINPTRFFRHHFNHSRASELRLTPSTLLTRAASISSGSEHILDGNDNCLIGTSKLRHARSPAYHAYRDAYLRYAFQFLRQGFEQAGSLPHQSLLGTETYNLKTVETYWERACLAPLEYVRNIIEQLMTYRTGLRVVAHMKATSYSRNENALSATLPLRKGVTLSVYAKTNFRVRYEIRHDLSISTDHGTAHTTNDLEQVLRWINAIAHVATDTINNIEALRPPMEPPAFDLEHLYGLVNALTNAPGNHADAVRVLSTLVASDSVSGAGDDAAILDHLRSVGVLQQAGRSMLVLAPEFRSVTRFIRARLSAPTGD